MESASPPGVFSAQPDRPLRASSAVLSTGGATGATAILDSEKGRFYSLNDAGGRVWSLLCEGTSFGAIVGRLQSEYEVSAEEAGADIEQLLRQLADAGLVRAEGEEVEHGEP